MAQEVSRLSIIVALGTNRVIGRDNGLIWNLPNDLKRFKELTTGHPVIMGRRTWESLPERFRPLPDRTNIVISRDHSYPANGAVLVQSFPEALSRAKEAPGAEEIFAIGGQQVFECALPFADRLYLTKVESTESGHAFFPEYEEQFPHVVSTESHEHEGLVYHYETRERS